MATPVSAGPSASDAALAEALFREGRALMNQRQYAAACAKLQESQRLDPSGGTLLNLAACHEAEGKLAAAWVEYSEALATARRDRRADREKVIKQRLTALDTRLPRLTIVVGPAAQIPGLALTRDGAPIAQPAWGVVMPVDPGTYAIVATAPERTPWQTSVTVGPGQRLRIDVPVLQALPVAPVAPTPAAVAPPVTEPAVPPAAAAILTEQAPVERSPRGLSQRTIWTLTAGGAGLALLAVGSIYGGLAWLRNDESKAHCRTTVLCNAEGVQIRTAAQDAASVATWLYVGGAVALAAGGVLWFVLTPRPGEPKRARHVTMVPSIGPAAVGFQLQGAL
jgi:tetratricopeptide (TPR) repeat protein